MERKKHTPKSPLIIGDFKNSPLERGGCEADGVCNSRKVSQQNYEFSNF